MLDVQGLVISGGGYTFEKRGIAYDRPRSFD